MLAAPDGNQEVFERIYPDPLGPRMIRLVIGILLFYLSINGFLNRPGYFWFLLVLLLGSLLIISNSLNIWWLPNTPYGVFRHSVETNGEIVKLYVSPGRIPPIWWIWLGKSSVLSDIRNPSCRIRIRFQTSENVEEAEYTLLELVVKSSVYQQFQNQANIKVHYAPKNPQIAVIEGERFPRYWM